jgi:hypothetical protein
MAAARRRHLPIPPPTTHHAHHQGTSSDLAPLTELIEAGRVTPSLERTYTLAQVPDALRRLDWGTVRGKLAVIP